jgi:tellurite resistance protein TehA-like permease
MLDQPLQPFSPPTDFLGHFPLLHASIISATTLVLYFVFAFWLVYTLVVIYHWLKYSHGSWITLPAIAIHLFISLCLISYLLSGAWVITSSLP